MKYFPRPFSQYRFRSPKKFLAIFLHHVFRTCLLPFIFLSIVYIVRAVYTSHNGRHFFLATLAKYGMLTCMTFFSTNECEPFEFVLFLSTRAASAYPRDHAATLFSTGYSELVAICFRIDLWKFSSCNISWIWCRHNIMIKPPPSSVRFTRSFM